MSYAHGTWRGVWSASSADRQPLVSIVIPNRNAAAVLTVCLRGLLHETQLSAPSNSSSSTTVRPSRRCSGLYRTIEDGGHGRIVPFDRPFNFSAACNAGAAAARGELLLFLNNDIEVIEPDWLDELVRWAERPGDRDRRCEAPVSESNDSARRCRLWAWWSRRSHLLEGAEGASSVFGSPECYRNYLAVTGACQMMRKDVFQRIGGFDERFRLSFSDVVLCMEAWKSRVPRCLHALCRLMHHESYSRKREDSTRDIELLARYLRGSGRSPEDPYFHPELNPKSLVPSCGHHSIRCRGGWSATSSIACSPRRIPRQSACTEADHVDSSPAITRALEASGGSFPALQAGDAARAGPRPRAFVPSGHYYSPIPSLEDIEASGRRGPRSSPLPGIDLNEAGQFALLEELAVHYPSMPFTERARRLSLPVRQSVLFLRRRNLPLTPCFGISGPGG